MMVPAEIQADASVYWLLALAMWPALKQASMYSMAFVLGLKMITKGLLWCLRGRTGGQKELGDGKAETRDKAE